MLARVAPGQPIKVSTPVSSTRDTQHTQAEGQGRLEETHGQGQGHGGRCGSEDCGIGVAMGKNIFQ